MKYYSENFEKLIFQTLYNIYERKYFEYVYYFGTSKMALDEKLEKLAIDDIFMVVDGMIQRYGFTKVWFSDEYHYIAEKGDISFLIEKKLAICGHVVGNDEEQVELYGDILNELLGTSRQ